MMWETENCWRLKWPWKTGGNGWRELNNLFRYGLIIKAKCLNSCQARWSLFFSRFNFVLSCCPGSKNLKTDCLSHEFDPESLNPTPKTMLPGSCFVLALSWEIGEKVKAALSDLNIPDNCPVSRLYVVPELRGEVIHLAHTNKTACHPGIQKTLYLVQQRFWWPK